MAVGPGAWGRRVWIKVLRGIHAGPGRQDRASGCSLRTGPKRPDQPFDPFAETTRLPRPQHVEDYDDLSIDPLSSDYFDKRLIDTVDKPVTVGAHRAGER